MQRQVVLALLTAQVALSAGLDDARAVETIRAFHVEVAAGAAADNALEQGIYLFRLGCSPNLSFCNLERITLNQCTVGKDAERAFLPQVDSWTTSSRRLEVRRSGNHEIELTVYQAFGQKLPARVVLTFVPGKAQPYDELAGFKTTGFIDLRLWPNIDKQIEYVPVESDRSKVLDCPVLLRGLKR
jgi:hypothetical protein